MEAPCAALLQKIRILDIKTCYVTLTTHIYIFGLVSRQIHPPGDRTEYQKKFNPIRGWTLLMGGRGCEDFSQKREKFSYPPKIRQNIFVPSQNFQKYFHTPPKFLKIFSYPLPIIKNNYDYQKRIYATSNFHTQKNNPLIPYVCNFMGRMLLMLKFSSIFKMY